MAKQQFDQSHSPVFGQNPAPETPPPVAEKIAHNPYAPVPPTERPEKRPTGKKWGMSLIWLAPLLLLGGTGVGALLWLVTTPPPPNCQQVSPLAADGERLYCARKAAESGDLDQLLAAIDLAESWTPDDPMYAQAQQLIGEWSKAILTLATQKVESGDMQGAINMISKIPKNSPTYDLVQEQVMAWQLHWDEGQVLYDKAQESLKAQDWRQASDYAQALSKLQNVFWQEKRYRDLLEQIALEKQGWQRLNEAKRLAQGETTPQRLSDAMNLALKISPDLYVRKQADQMVGAWSRELLKMASERLQNKDLPGALTIANFIPPQSSVYAEAQDLIQLGRSQAVIGNQALGMPNVGHILTLLDGRAAAAQITADRPLYEAAQEQVKTVDAQIEDLIQLQFASFVASWDHPWTLKLAVDQASMVAVNRPRRVHAQTLVAHWRQEIQRKQDLPYLNLAEQLAKAKTVQGYQAAIQQARQVELGRPLRVKAQTLIASWTKQTQIIEDKPLLDQAQELAKAGKLNEAAEMAGKIQKDRALYNDANNLRKQWLADLQIAQDQPILTQASALAAQGKLTAAIDTAAQIGSGRALYNEAQSAINRWASERDAIWSARQAETAPQATSAVNSYDPAPAAAPQEDYYAPPEPAYSEPAPAPEPAAYSEPAPAPEPEYIEPAPLPPETNEPPAVVVEPAPEPEAPVLEPLPEAEPIAPVVDNNLLQE